MSSIHPTIRARARHLRVEMTSQERKVWAQLRDINHRLGLNFRRQAPVGRFIADFVEFGRKLVIEIDGGQHGGADDATRDYWFQGQGFVTLRFWNNEVDGNLDGVIQKVLDAIEDCPHPPTPPHEGEERRMTTKGGAE